MIVCSCNVISDHEVRDVAARAVVPGHMTEVYRTLGRKPQCGHCQHTIKEIVKGASHTRRVAHN